MEKRSGQWFFTVQTRNQAFEEYGCTCDGCCEAILLESSLRERAEQRVSGSPICGRETPNLLPCPFCGSNDLIKEHDESHATLVAMRCNGCGASPGYCGSEEKAAEVWNTRHQRADKRVSQRHRSGLKEIRAHSKTELILFGRNLPAVRKPKSRG